MCSRTGLLASPTKKSSKISNVNCVHLKPITRRAPFTLKPFAGLYNPYPYGCSLLCKHPIDDEAKELLQKAKNTWANEGRNLLLAEEIEAIRANLNDIQLNQKNYDKLIDTVPEELFRPYTETDSIPGTPAATLASRQSKTSVSRRCLTPDILTNQVKEKTLLVVDLRRSHSQETLSWHGSSSIVEPPIMTIQKAPTRSGSYENFKKSPKLSPRFLPKKPLIPEIKQHIIDDNKDNKKNYDDNGHDDDDDGEFVKRRGKNRRRKRDHSIAPQKQSSIEPETQIGQLPIDDIGDDLAKTKSLENCKRGRSSGKISGRHKSQGLIKIDCYLDWEILKQLRRELDETVVENEFNFKRKQALKEALKTLPKDRVDCAELTQLKSELQLNKIDTDFFLSLPRVFSRLSAQFEFPFDRQSLISMTPLDYLRNNVLVTSPRKFLYRCVYDKVTTQEDNQQKRTFTGLDLFPALDLMMGKPLSNQQKIDYRKLINFTDDLVIDFQLFCGICALCERIFACEYCPKLPSRSIDPPHEVEIADFQALPRKLAGLKIDENLIEIFDKINQL